jgi:hypothetical protein
VSLRICVEVKEDKTINVDCVGNQDVCDLIQQILLAQLKIIDFITKIISLKQEKE